MAYEQAQTVMQREKPEVDPSREALCKEWQEKVREAKNFWRDDFERMRKSSRYVRGKQWPRQTKDDERYIANITHRHVQQRTAALYAKNPRAVAKPRPRLNYMLWDGNEQTAMMAEQGAAAAMQGGMMPDPQTAALLQDIAAGKQHKDMIDRIGKTLEIVFAYQLSEPKPKFKPQAKQAVRRCLTTGVAHLKLGYQRVAQYPPAIESQIQDVSKQLAEIERLAADVADREIEPDDAEMEQLRLMLIDLQASDKILLRDGLVFGFPKSTSIIVDPACTQLKGFVGAGWVAEEFCLTPNEVKRRYKIDIGKEFSQHAEASNKRRQGKNKPGMSWALVWEIYDLDNHLRHVVCDGYCDFLEADGSPDITLEQFHPYFTLTFNDIEDDDETGSIYPPTNPELLMPMQREINRSRESLRQHRIGNRPATVGATGVLGPKDKDKMMTHLDHEHIELDVPRDTDIGKVFQRKPYAPIDPPLYETESTFQDVLHVIGDNETNFGGTAGDTATESTIAETSRMSTLDSNRDDLDEWLTEFAEAAGQVLLSEMDQATVKKIVGEGAVWPQLSRQEIAEELFLEIAAGSSGRPNEALEIAKTERLAPFAVQIPGINPTWLGRKMVRLMDAEADYEDAIVEGMPSITMLNAQKQPGTGDPASDPNAQGPEGGQNQAQPQQGQPGPQPGFPMPGMTPPTVQ